jgi:hypothetical protein
VQAVDAAPPIRCPSSGELLLEEIEVRAKVPGRRLLELSDREHHRVLACSVQLDSGEVSPGMSAVLRALLSIAQHQPQINEALQRAGFKHAHVAVEERLRVGVDPEYAQNE